MTAEPAPATSLEVDGYSLPLDRRYDAEAHVWAKVLPDGLVRVGMDALSVETTGTLAGLGFVPEGTFVRRGQPLGTVEAAKFVGPLTCPVSGTLVRANAAVLADPSLIEADPYGDGWLADIDPSDLAAESESLLSGQDELRTWLAADVLDYRERGLIAE